MKNKMRGAKRSFTVWFNSVFVAALPILEAVKDAAPQVQHYVTPEAYKWVGLFVVIVNILLRFKTNTGLADK